MLGVENYGSDDEGDVETKPVNPTPAPKKSAFSLPPPSASKASGLALPPPSVSTRPKKTKKIAFGLPELQKGDGDEAEDDDAPPAKKQRLEGGSGRSGLLSMLPAPKQQAPVLPKPERVLGGGQGPGLVFNSRPASSAPTAQLDEETEFSTDTVGDDETGLTTEYSRPAASTLFAFAPRKGKGNISLEEPAPRAPPKTVSSAPAVDFFSLGSAKPPVTSLPLKPATPTPSTSSLVPSAAPKVEDFTPPEPTREDPYPGYYQLSSGGWAAYDPAYYKKFYDRWKKEYDDHVRGLEKGTVKGFEGLDRMGATDLDPIAEMEKSKVQVKELEERKALTHGAGGAPDAPRMNIQGAKLGGRARSRHQLTTLLTEAYTNREAMEEKIAEGRRNRKEAGKKYGF